MPQALIVQGGWDGHTPKQSGELFADELRGEGFDVAVRDTLDAYTDASLMASVSLIVPIWTMGEIAHEQWKGLSDAVHGGAGVAGFHGGMIDAFRNNVVYHWMTGAQWVAHPGDCDLTYRVDIADADHEITRGIEPFSMPNTEQYYCHHDPANHVLCTTTFTHEDERSASLYRRGVTLPYAYTKSWGQGRVFCACWGHTVKDFDVPEAKEIVKRGMLWAAKA